MAQHTQNYGLLMPDATDDFLDFRESYNENLEIIDENMGGGGGASALEDLSDVNITNPTDGQVLKYDAQNDEWINANGGGGGGSLDAVETNSNAYALLPQADKEDPTKIYFLNDTQSSMVDTPIDQSTFVLKVENQSQMNVAVTDGKLVSVYNYGSSIGACAFEPNAISETASKIKFKFTTLGSYDTAQSHAITIGVKANYQSSNWIFSTDADWIVKKVYDTRNTSVDDYIDISGITTPCYLMICFHGWTVTFDEFLVEDVSVPTGDTEIRYKDVPYGDNGGESGGNYYLNTLYSTEEKKIGYWTDGKPLYQKTVVLSNISYDSNWHSYAHGISNIDEIADIKGVFANSTESFEINSFRPTTTQGLLVGADSTNIRYMNNWQNDATRNIVITLQYTKTTDTPEPNPQTGGVIYLPTIYSDEEREIGVWRDGKPLYQKTVHFGGMPTSGTKSVAHGITNFETMFIVNFCASQNGYYTSLPYVLAGSSQGIEVYLTDTNINVKVGQTYSYNDSYVTIRYTKTTDVAGSGTWTPSGELAHHYSTNEQVIGTWVDGKPLYEKCFTYSSVSFSNQQMALANDLSNVDCVVSYGGCAKEPRDNRNVPLPYMRKAWGESIILQIMQLPDGTLSIAIVTSDSWYTSLENIVVWVRYTKTTD